MSRPPYTQYQDVRSIIIIINNNNNNNYSYNDKINNILLKLHNNYKIKAKRKFEYVHQY